MNKTIHIILATMLAASALAQVRLPPGTATPRSPAPAADKAAAPTDKRAFNWDQAPLDLVLKAYGDEINKTVITDPNVPKANITLKSKEGQELTQEEYLEAIEVVLEMNNVHLEPYGDKFVRAIPRAKARKEGVPLFLNMNFSAIDDYYKKDGKVISMMLKFENIGTEEAQKALEGFKSDSGLLQVFERINSILITDTYQNIKRMSEIAQAIDKSVPVNEHTFVRQIKYASARDIKLVLEAIVEDSIKQLEKNKAANKNAVQTSTSQPTTMVSPALSKFGLTKQNPQAQAQTVNNATQFTKSDAEKGLISGRVLIIAEERSNKLVIVTNDDNMKAFDDLIPQLDIETTPDTVVKVYRLKYADAEDVSDMINDLIGNASKSSTKGSQNANSKKTATSTKNNTAQSKSVNQRSGEPKAGELSKDNTTVLADKRINGLVVMTDKELVSTLETIIESMDVKLSQVLIETCIVEVGLGHNIKTGIDWVRGMQNNNGQYQQAIGGGGGDKSPVSIAGGVASNLISGVALPSIFTPGSSGLTYAIFDSKLDLGAVISMSQSDSTSKYIASPVVMTVDNKEATIEATQARKFLSTYQSSSSSSYYGSSIVPQYENKDIGIKIKLTPKINPNGTVMLEVEEEYSQVGAKQAILDPSSKEVQIDTALTRKMAADVVLDHEQTVVLGGLTDTYTETADTGIPILKDIPLIGKYLFGNTSSKETRSELLVFLTPYVITDANQAEAEALRRKKALSEQRPWEDHGWSKSKLADPVSAKEQLRKQKAEWKKLDEEHKSERELQKAKEDRISILKERAQDEAEEDMERALISEDEEVEPPKSEVKVEGATLLGQVEDELKVEPAEKKTEEVKADAPAEKGND